MDTTAGDTILAIETFVYTWLEILCDPNSGDVPSFEVPKRTKENVILSAAEEGAHHTLQHQDGIIVKKLR